MDVKQPKPYRVKLAFDQYSVGHVIYPTGLWRSSLLSRGYIEPVPDQEEVSTLSLPEYPTEPTNEPKRDRRRRASHVD